MFRSLFRVSTKRLARKKGEEGDEVLDAIKDFLRPATFVPKIKDDKAWDQDRRDQNLAVCRSFAQENENQYFDHEVAFKRKLKMDAIDAMPAEFQKETEKPWMKPPAMPQMSITPKIPSGHYWDPPQLTQDESRARY